MPQRDVMLEAAERVVDKFVSALGTMAVQLPPSGRMTVDQEVQVYLGVIANPLAVAVLKRLKGEDEYALWSDAMAYRARMLGKADMNMPTSP